VIVRLAVAAVILFYAVLGFAVLAPESVYSGDIGVKFVQARALADHHFRSLDIPYRGEFLDPARAYFPLRPPFVMKTGGETQAIFPPASSVLQAVAVQFGGFRGMVALSLIAAAVVLIASCAMAPPPYRLATACAVGLAGPLWFYAISGWEHAPAVAFSTAAFAVALRSPLGWSACAAGLLLASGATLRDEVILLAPGLLLIVWYRQRGWRQIAAAIAGLMIPLLLAAAVEVWWFGRPAAAHLRHAVHLLQTALRVSDEPNPDVPVLEPMTPRQRYDTVAVYWTFGRGTDAQVAGFVLGLLAALFVRWRWRSSAGILLWLAAFAVTTAGDVREVVTAPKWLAGLVRVSPFVVFSILPFAAAGAKKPDEAAAVRPPRDSWDGRALPVLFALTALIYLVMAFAGVDTSGGKSLGPRLLLPLLPLLCVSSLIVMASYLKSPFVVDRAVGWIGVALVAAGVTIHLAGTIPAYRQRNADDASAIRAAAASSERIVVADDVFTAQLLLPLYDRKIVLLADTIESGAQLGALLASQRTGAILVSRNVEPAVGFPPLKLARTDARGRMVVQVWRP
jgi:hypothetical protein